MATITPEATATDGGLTLADTDPEVEHFAPGSDRFVVTFRFIGPDLLQLQNVLAPRLAGIGVGRSTRTAKTISPTASSTAARATLGRGPGIRWPTSATKR
jgi:hypothetical protein